MVRVTPCLLRWLLGVLVSVVCVSRFLSVRCPTWLCEFWGSGWMAGHLASSNGTGTGSHTPLTVTPCGLKIHKRTSDTDRPHTSERTRNRNTQQTTDTSTPSNHRNKHGVTHTTHRSDHQPSDNDSTGRQATRAGRGSLQILVGTYQVWPC